MNIEFEYCVGTNTGLYKHNFNPLTRPVKTREEVLEHYRLLKKVFDCRYGKGPKMHVELVHYIHRKGGNVDRGHGHPLRWLKQAEREINDRLKLPTQVAQMYEVRDNVTSILNKTQDDMRPFRYAFDYRETSTGMLLVKSMDDIQRLVERTIRRAYNHAARMHEYVERSKNGMEPEEEKK